MKATKTYTLLTYEVKADELLSLLDLPKGSGICRVSAAGYLPFGECAEQVEISFSWDRPQVRFTADAVMESAVILRLLKQEIGSLVSMAWDQERGVVVFGVLVPGPKT